MGDQRCEDVRLLAPAPLPTRRSPPQSFRVHRRPRWLRPADRPELLPSGPLRSGRRGPSFVTRPYPLPSSLPHLHGGGVTGAIIPCPATKRHESPSQPDPSLQPYRHARHTPPAPSGHAERSKEVTGYRASGEPETSHAKPTGMCEMWVSDKDVACDHCSYPSLLFSPIVSYSDAHAWKGVDCGHVPVGNSDRQRSAGYPWVVGRDCVRFARRSTRVPALLGDASPCLLVPAGLK